MQRNRQTRFRASCLAVVALVAGYLGNSAITGPVKAQTSVSITYFDGHLGPYGYWVEDPTYGRVWRPRETSADWRPYTYGRWVYTTQYGWIWASEEPWGWVVYHYGRWVWSSRYGWVWVPGDEWGPAWVEWCYGGGYVGWAPMPPDPYWQGTYYYGGYDCVSPGYYSRAVFVSETYFASARVSAHVVVPSQNAIAARGTVNVTNYSRAGAGIVNRSIDVKKLQATTGQTITPVRVVQSKGPVVPGIPAGPLKEIRIYRPLVTTAPNPWKADVSSPPLKLDPKASGVEPSAESLETGTLPPLDKPDIGSVSPPPLNSPSLSGPSLSNPVGGVLRGGRLGR